MDEKFNFIVDGLVKNDFTVVDGFLNDEEVQRILAAEFSHGLSYFRPAGISKQKQVETSIRSDYIQWIDPEEAHDAVRLYIERLQQLITFLNRELFLSLKEPELHLTIYPPGSFYKRHLDQFREDDHRKLSVICYLNHDWLEEQGGQLRLYLPEGHLDIWPEAGRLVCFRSDRIEHEVLPATRERLSITGWILDTWVALRHL
jgi:SM-20-related protein